MGDHVKFRPKTLEIDAVQWTGTNIQEVSEFVAGCKLEPLDIAALILGKNQNGRAVNFNLCMAPPVVSVCSSQEWTHTEVGGYVLRLGAECYAWDRRIFEQAYEPSTPPEDPEDPDWSRGGRADRVFGMLRVDRVLGLLYDFARNPINDGSLSMGIDAICAATLLDQEPAMEIVRFLVTRELAEEPTPGRLRITPRGAAWYARGPISQ